MSPKPCKYEKKCVSLQQIFNILLEMEKNNTLTEELKEPKAPMLDAFFRIHDFLVEHSSMPIRRKLMDEINWEDRLIAIKGGRGVGKTDFLLARVKEIETEWKNMPEPENLGRRRKRKSEKEIRPCLYVSFNDFFFTEHTLVELAGKFAKEGGKYLFLDQLFKYPNWSRELKRCYNKYKNLHIIFCATPVMPIDEDNNDLKDIAKTYNLRGFSFREYLNLQTGLRFHPYTLEEIIQRHASISREICERVRPLDYFKAYLDHGYYPSYLESSSFEAELLKVMNSQLEVDVLIIKEIDVACLHKLRKLLYILMQEAPSALNVSNISDEIGLSRATTMNYIKYLSDARLLNMIYRHGEEFPKKPSGLYLHNTNLMYAMTPGKTDEETLMETFFQNALWGRHKVEAGDRSSTFIVDGKQRFRICLEHPKRKNTDVLYALSGIAEGAEQEIPIWVYGFLY